jgi:hypothetical protein
VSGNRQNFRIATLADLGRSSVGDHPKGVGEETAGKKATDSVISITRVKAALNEAAGAEGGFEPFAVAHAGLPSAPLADVYGISIMNRSGGTFRRFAFFTRNDTEWRRIS